MVSRKYTKDYRIEPYLDRNGRLRDRSVYCGAYFTFDAPLPEVRRTMWLLAGLNLFITVTVALPMAFACSYFRQFYLVLPQAFLFLPVYFTWAGLLRVYTAKDKVTREHRDKIVHRIPVASLFTLILSAVLGIGTVIYACLGGLQGADYLAAVCSFLRLIPAIWAFLLRKRFPMKELPA